MSEIKIKPTKTMTFGMTNNTSLETRTKTKLRRQTETKTKIVRQRRNKYHLPVGARLSDKKSFLYFPARLTSLLVITSTPDNSLREIKIDFIQITHNFLHQLQNNRVGTD